MAGREVFQRCGCVNPATGRRWDRACPRLNDPGHGSWYFTCTLPDLAGRARRVRRGGHPTPDVALLARGRYLAQHTARRAGGGWTVAWWLRHWLHSRVAIRPTTRLSHDGYIEHFLIPHIGHLHLDELNVTHLSQMFTHIAGQLNRAGRPHTPSTLAHIRTTLRAALNAAIREGLLVDNPARHVELPPHPRPYPVVWTPARVAAWRATGTRPRIAVWNPTQVATFLDAVRDDRLLALWWLLALRGLRRGEAAALRWADVDLDHRELEVRRARTTAGYEVFENAPKSAAGRRTVALDKHTVKVLRAHHHRQHPDSAATWTDSGYVFTGPDGQPLHPDAITRRFRRLVAATGLPPIRLHDLRHGAACLAHAAGADLKTIQQQLGHSTITVTADTYTTVLPAAQRRSAKATAKLVINATRTRTAKTIRHGKAA